MPTGSVKFFNDSKGFGFITEDVSNQEIFVHVSELQELIKENDKVEFEKQKGQKGINAINVRKAK